MRFCEAMDLLKSGKKVTRNDWREGLYFVVEEGKVCSYRPNLSTYNYSEDIMVSDGWLVDGDEEEKKFCDIIPDLQKGLRARMKDWSFEFFIYLDGKNGLLIHKMCKFDYHPSFDDFKAEDWIEI